MLSSSSQFFRNSKRGKTLKKSLSWTTEIFMVPNNENMISDLLFGWVSVFPILDPWTVAQQGPERRVCGGKDRSPDSWHTRAQSACITMPYPDKPTHFPSAFLTGGRQCFGNPKNKSHHIVWEGVVSVVHLQMAKHGKPMFYLQLSVSLVKKSSEPELQTRLGNKTMRYLL